jgi:hypothetical protein
MVDRDIRIKMIARRVFEEIRTAAGEPETWRQRVAATPVACGHRTDWRCLLASMVSAPLPGCIVRVGQFTLEIQPPTLYRNGRREITVAIPGPVRRIMHDQSTPEGMQGRRFMSCPTSPDVRPSARKHAQRSRRLI